MPKKGETKKKSKTKSEEDAVAMPTAKETPQPSLPQKKEVLPENFNLNMEWDILDKYFCHGGNTECPNQLVKHQIDSFNEFIDRKLNQILVGFNPIKVQHGFKEEINNYTYKMKINILNPSLSKPMYQKQDGTQIVMTPHMARMNNLTYSSNIYVNVHIIIEYINEDGVIEKYDKNYENVYIGKIPVMIGSKTCILTTIPGIGNMSNDECKYDFGGYFIINGNEKVLVSQDRIKENHSLTFQPNNNMDGIYAEIRSMNDTSYLPPKTTALNMSGKLNHMGRIIRMSASFLKFEIPVFVMFRAIGILSDKEIIEHILLDPSDIANAKMSSELMACCEDASDIHTQHQAELVLLKNMTGASKAPKTIESLKYAILNDFLPHVGKNYRRKALYLGFMIRKMLRIFLGYDIYDNRDSYMNKRIDTPGILMSNLFRQCYGKMTKEMKTLIERELNLWRSSTSPQIHNIITEGNIHKYFKQSLMDSWLKYALSTGNWGIKSIGSYQTIKQGVSQVLNRMSYHSALSHLRRINTAMEKNGKLVQPRKLDNSQYGMICPAETPEGAPVGLVKNLALSACISISMPSTFIRTLLIENGVVEYNDSFSYNIFNTESHSVETSNDIQPRTTINEDDTWYEETVQMKMQRQLSEQYLKKMGDKNNAIVMVNGDIVGYHTDPPTLYETFKKYKRTGYIYPMTGVVWNIKNRILSFSTEAGRMYRPLYIVDRTIDENGKFKYDLRINNILRKLNMTFKEFCKDKSFDSFICPDINNNIECTDDNTKYAVKPEYENCREGFIEYMDVDEIDNAMIAMFPKDLYKGMKGHALPPIYTHCEIHPSLMNGVLGVNVPFSDHNQSPRNCYQCIGQNELVSMANGSVKQIKDIRNGDNVICYDTETMNYENTVVINHAQFKTSKLVYSVYNISGYSVVATHDHKFTTLENGWKQVIDLKYKDKLGIMLMPNGVENTLPKSKNKIQILLYNSIIQDNTEIPLEELSGTIANKKSRDRKYPITNHYIHLPVLARLVGYWSANATYFHSTDDKAAFDKDVHMLGFKDANDREFLFIMETMKNNISWIYDCSMLVKREYIAGVLSANYKASNFIIRKILVEFGLDSDWHKEKEVQNSNGFVELKNKFNKFYKLFGLRYNIAQLRDIAIQSFYEDHITYSGRMNIQPLNQQDWEAVIVFKGNMIFIPFHTIKKSYNNIVCDIEVENENHCFIAGCFGVSNCAMGKQALGVYVSNFNNRIDTLANVLNYPQKPLVNTKLSKYTHTQHMPSGNNAIVAIMTMTGFNQEDSLMINQAALDRGLFVSTHYKALRDQCSKNHSTGEEEKFTKPEGDHKMKQYNYEKIGEDGFIPINTHIDGNDVIVGKVMPRKTNGVMNYIDNSVTMKSDDDGYIDMNYTDTNQDGYKFCKVRIRKYRKPEIGDKLACYSPDHEYLTTEGWVPVSELTLEHKVATLVDDKLVYQNPTELHEFDHKVSSEKQSRRFDCNTKPPYAL
jgi:DNA-directed RNA polymerase beta subunit